MKIVRNLSRILYAMVLFLIYNCQPNTIAEEKTEELISQKSPFKTMLVSKQAIENNSRLNERMRNLTTIQQSNLAENTDSELYNFSIHTDAIKLVENVQTNAHSYTFPVSRENDTSILENVVFSFNEIENDYDASFITYHFSEQQRQEFEDTKHVNTSYEITYQSLILDLADLLGEDSLPCTITYQEFHQPQNSTNTYLYSSNGYEINQCEHENDDDPCNTYMEIVIYCPSSGGTSGTGTDDNTTNDTSSPSTSGGGGTTTNTNTSDDEDTMNVVTSPMTREEAIKQSIIECINSIFQFNSIDNTTIDYRILDQNDLTIDTWISLNNYLNDNGCSEDAQQDVIDAIIDAYDNYKIINELQGKALCVYNKLKSSNSGFKNAIKKFDGEFPVAHIKFVEQDLGLARGATLPPVNGLSPDYVITVALNNNSNSQGIDYRPNLLMAKTIIHEVIHAEMFRKIMSAIQQGNFDQITQQQLTNILSNGDFPGIYDYYRRYKDWQHSQMAAHYRVTIARVLQEFDTGVAVPDNQQPQQLYLDLSWEGLKYNAIPTWSNLPQAEKDRINTVIANYINNNKYEICTP